MEVSCACPKCSGLGTLLGRLGRLLWLRCRSCGWTYEIEADVEVA